MFEKFLTEVLKLAPRQMWGVEQQKIQFKKIFTSKSIRGAIAAILAIIELFGLTIFDYPTTPRGEELNLDGYSLVFEDQFEGDTLNTDVWKYCNTGVRRGGYRTPSQVEVKDGNCVITAEYLEDGQFGAGWYAGDLALAIFSIIEAGVYEGNEGIYHFSNEGVCSWYDFAVEIANVAGNTNCRINPCHSSEFPSPVTRPPYSVLDKTKIKNTFDIDIPHWRESMEYCIKRIKATNK